MSSIGDYVTTEGFTRKIGMDEEQISEGVREWIQDNSPAANRQVDNDLSGFSTSVPFTDTDVTPDKIDAANTYLAYLWTVKEDDEKGQAKFSKLYNNIMQGVRNRLKNTPNNTGGQLLYKTSGNQATQTL